VVFIALSLIEKVLIQPVLDVGQILMQGGANADTPLVSSSR